jgi:hypothetical protein
MPNKDGLTSLEIAEMINELDARMITAREEQTARLNYPEKAKLTYHLVTKACRTAKTASMVIVQVGEQFILGVSSPTNGYHFDTFNRAKVAASKWNRALDTAQKLHGCEVFPCNRSQYLEYVLDRGAELRPLLEGALARTREAEEAKATKH